MSNMANCNPNSPPPGKEKKEKKIQNKKTLGELKYGQLN
jgi:hypothetical protein